MVFPQVISKKRNVVSTPTMNHPPNINLYQQILLSGEGKMSDFAGNRRLGRSTRVSA